jgi:peptidoglycan endopeptidase LytF
MTRKDTIIIAVLVNAGLLAILFAAAWHGDEDKVSDQAIVSQAMSEVQKSPAQPQEALAATAASAAAPAAAPTPKDEIDLVLQRYAAAQQSQAGGAATMEVQPTTTVVTPASTTVVSAATPAAEQGSTFDVTVKRGDVLTKIARANNTTVEKIMKANGLANHNLKIGQVLKIPKGDAAGSLSAPIAAAQKAAAATSKEIALADVRYYTVQAGDTPWGIAKKNSVKLDELLRMNNINDEKARNLKVGEKLRVK